MTAHHRPNSTTVYGLAAPLLLVALGTAVQPAPPPADMVPPSALEQALLERACSSNQTSADAAAHEKCIADGLMDMRTVFGRDLGKLTPPERRSIDAACSNVRQLEGREVYLDCMNGKLAQLRAKHAPPPAPAPTAVAPADASETPAPVVEQAAPPQSHKMRVVAIAGSVVLVVGAAVGGVLFSRRKRPVRRVCRTCGAEVAGTGDLCATCRHEAAEALRRSALERAEHEHAAAEDAKRRQEQEEEEHRQRARAEEEQRARELENARRREEAYRREEEERARRQAQADEAERRNRDEMSADASDSVFDPYAVLGVKRDVSAEAIRAAYEQARSKYDPDLVGNLGEEVRAVFKAKADAAERAYQMLTQ